MELLISFLLLFIFTSCTNKSSNSIGTEQDCAYILPTMKLEDSVIISNKESVIISNKEIVIKDVLWQYSIVGRTANLGNLISLDYDKAIVSGDTLILVAEEKKFLSLIDFHDICKPKTEKRIRDLMGDGYKMYKTVEDSDMVHNTDGNYEIPYLFFINGQDSLQYMITFPIEEEKKPYTYEFCEAIFLRNSKNIIAKKIFKALSQWSIDNFVKKYPRYNHIWLIPTSQEDNYKEWSLFVWFDNLGFKRALISINASGEIVYNRKQMAQDMYGLDKK